MSSNESVLALAMAVKEQTTKIGQDGVSLVKLAETNLKAIKESDLNVNAISDDVMISLIEAVTYNQRIKK